MSQERIDRILAAQAEIANVNTAIIQLQVLDDLYCDAFKAGVESARGESTTKESPTKIISPKEFYDALIRTQVDQIQECLSRCKLFVRLERKVLPEVVLILREAGWLMSSSGLTKDGHGYSLSARGSK